MAKLKKINSTYITVLLLLMLSVICFSASYAFFTSVNEEHGKLNIVVGNLTYKLESNELTNHQITVNPGETKELLVTLTSLNSIDSMYELYYTLEQENVNVKVGYSNDTKDAVLGKISANSSKTITIGVNNGSDKSITITFSVIGGLVNNELVLTEGYSLNQVIETKVGPPIIAGGSDNWVSVAPTISVLQAGSALSGVKHYEYYKSATNKNPEKFTVATGTTSNNLTISDEGTTYVWYRTVSNNGNKSAWTGPQVVNLGALLKDKILRDNVVITESPTLTTTSEEANENGLYKSITTNNGNPTYYFRGNIDNNYVDFAGFVWRIVRINEDGTIRLILQDGINNNTFYHFNSTGQSYNYYSNSEAKTRLENWYNNTLNKEFLDKVVTGGYFCEQHKANLNYESTSGLSYLEYIPNFKCANINNYGIVNSNIGLLTYDELVHAGGYPYKKNSNNYLYDNTEQFWTMSYADLYGDFNKVWIGNFPSPYPIHEFYYDWKNDSGKLLRPVINLRENIIVTGTGNSSDKYIVQH